MKVNVYSQGSLKDWGACDRRDEGVEDWVFPRRSSLGEVLIQI
jgi:hypothetical protein